MGSIELKKRLRGKTVNFAKLRKHIPVNYKCKV